MNTESMIHLYQDEEFAMEVFKTYRFRKGIVCKRCNCNEHYWLKSKNQFKCKSCKFRTTLRSGTVLEGSKLPVSYFLIALHLLSEKGDNVSPEELQRVTNHKYFDPVWMFLRKIKAFVKEDDQKVCIKNFTEVIQDLQVRNPHYLINQ